MKRTTMLLIAFAAFAQEADVIPLAPREVQQLLDLSAATATAYKAYLAAQDRQCKLEAALKKQHAVKETSGSCGSSSWSTEAYAVTSTGTGTILLNGPSSRWTFSSDKKYLIRK